MHYHEHWTYMYISTLIIYRLDKQLKEFEVKYHLLCWWDTASRDYTEAQMALSLERRDDVGEAMWAASSRRQYLLKTKAKYAGMFFSCL